MIEPNEAAYIQHLEAEIQKLQAQIQERDAEIKRLRKEKGISDAREGLTFDARMGIWSDQSGNHFCPKCIGDEKRNPLKTEERGWRCAVCGHYFGNPDKPLPSVRRRGGSWMSG